MTNNKNFNLNREPIIINTHGETVEQLDNTGGHQSYLDLYCYEESAPIQINRVKLWDEK